MQSCKCLGVHMGPTRQPPGWFLNNDSQGRSVEAQQLAQDGAAGKLSLDLGFCEDFPHVWLPPSFLILHFLTHLLPKTLSFLLGTFLGTWSKTPISSMVSVLEVSLLGTSFQVSESLSCKRKITLRMCSFKREILDLRWTLLGGRVRCIRDFLSK